VCFGDVRQDEPHRVYLVGFPALGVLKVAITNSRNDHQIEDHATTSAVLLDVIDTDDRAVAYSVAGAVLTAYRPRAATWLTVEHFPQGG
jgi:hypothetical protein